MQHPTSSSIRKDIFDRQNEPVSGPWILVIGLKLISFIQRRAQEPNTQPQSIGALRKALNYRPEYLLFLSWFLAAFENWFCSLHLLFPSCLSFKAALLVVLDHGYGSPQWEIEDILRNDSRREEEHLAQQGAVSWGSCSRTSRLEFWRAFLDGWFFQGFASFYDLQRQQLRGQPDLILHHH